MVDLGALDLVLVYLEELLETEAGLTTAEVAEVVAVALLDILVPAAREQIPVLVLLVELAVVVVADTIMVASLLAVEVASAYTALVPAA